VTILNLSVLTTGLWGDGVSSCSVLELAARQGPSTHSTHTHIDEAPGCVSLVVVPQANLISKVKSQGKSIQYHGQIGKEQGEQLYDYFCDCITAAILEEQCRVRQTVLPASYLSWKDLNGFSTATAAAAAAAAAASSAQTTVDPGTPPDQIFRDAAKYASWDDETGLPLTDAAGESLTKSALKKLRKLQDAHAKRHAKWKLLANNPHGDDNDVNTAAVAVAAAAAADVPAVSDITAAVKGLDMAADSRSQQAAAAAEHAAAAASDDQDQQQQQHHEWQSAMDPTFCHVVAGSFGKRQGLEMQSDMGPFCHVLQV
jgi:hypothetical protein